MWVEYFIVMNECYEGSVKLMVNNSTFFVALSEGVEAKSFKKGVIRSRVYMRIVWRDDHCVGVWT